MRRWIGLLLVLSLLIGGMSGCAGSQGSAESETSGLQGIETEPPASDIDNLSATTCYQNDGDLMGFGLRMLQLTAEKNAAENAVISPLSAYVAVCMAANGAEGQTRAELETVLGGDISEQSKAVAARMNALCRVQGATELSYANSVWVDDRLIANTEFCENMQRYFDAEMRLQRLSGLQTMQDVNAWVEDKTNGMLSSLLPKPLDEDARMLLINTLYFKAKWQVPFKSEDSSEAVFTTGTGETKKVPFLWSLWTARDYFKLEHCDGVVLPYDDSRTAMVLLKPTQGQNVRTLLQQLDAQTIGSAVKEAERTPMYLGLPKFTVSFESSLKGVLSDMGIQRAFLPELAEFGGIGTAEDVLHIDEVLQKVKVIVDEEGTQAAAATEVIFTFKSAALPEETVDVIFDEPFVYAIVDLETETPLFLGVMNDPS